MHWEKSGTPSVGVVLPCKNEAATIARCLTALRNQVPAPSVIVVVDNGSTDGSLEIARDLADVVLQIATGPISALRNAGAAAAGDVDILAFVDTDVEVAPGWLAAAVEGLQTADLVGSRMLAAPDGTWVERHWAALETLQEHDGSHVWSGHLAMTMTLFEKLEGFNEGMTTGEDADLSRRTRDVGGTVALVPAMSAIHHGYPSTLGEMLRRETWHTSTAGWFERMSPKSRALVTLTAGWAAAGLAAGVLSATRHRPAVSVSWLAATAAAVPALGAVGGSARRNAVPNGVLLALWAGIRAVRLPQELAHVRTSRRTVLR